MRDLTYSRVVSFFISSSLYTLTSFSIVNFKKEVTMTPPCITLEGKRAVLEVPPIGTAPQGYGLLEIKRGVLQLELRPLSGGAPAFAFPPLRHPLP